MVDSVIVISVSAVLAGLAVSIAIRRPSVFVLGMGVAALLAIAARSEKMQGRSNEYQQGVEEIKPTSSIIGATSNSTPMDMGPARMHEPVETPVVDPSLYPVPFRVRYSKFSEAAGDERLRWNTTGPEGPYTAWRRGFF
jgi:hypothetical protein